MLRKMSDIFSGIAYKTLVPVDLPGRGSHQHELNGSRLLTDILGADRTTGQIEWKRFTDDEAPLTESGTFTWYDARQKSSKRTHRSEWRLYYKGEFLSHARTGDTFVLARKVSGEMLGLVFK